MGGEKPSLSVRHLASDISLDLLLLGLLLDFLLGLLLDLAPVLLPAGDPVRRNGPAPHLLVLVVEGPIGAGDVFGQSTVWYG